MSEARALAPLTMAVFAYNQENFVAQAVAGALAQDHPRLEIILSDDGSSDRTFAIMEEMAAAYRGPHRLRLNRNPENLGIGGHITRVFALARTDLVVVAAGDDISLPHRCSAMGTAAQAHPGAAGFCSAYQTIDAQGAVIERHCRPGWPRSIEDLIVHGKRVPGATAAWRRDLAFAPTPLPPQLMYEDAALALRALLGGGMVALEDEPLVQYRTLVGISGQDGAWRATRFHRLRPRTLARWSVLLGLWQRDLAAADTGAQRAAHLAAVRAARVENAALHHHARGRRSGARWLVAHARARSAKAALFALAGYRYPRLLDRYLAWRHRG